MKDMQSEQMRYLCRDILPLLNAVSNGFAYDPGSSDLDNKQPITVRMTLGDYRRACRLKYVVQEAI